MSSSEQDSWYVRKLLYARVDTYHNTMQFKSPHIVNYLPPDGAEVDERRLHARLVVGECRQSIMTVEYRPETDVTKRVAEEFSTVRLKSAL